MGGRTDDHEYRGSHHQTPGTLQGGRTDAQTNLDVLTITDVLIHTTAPEEAIAALARLGARLVDVDYIGALNKALNEQNTSLTVRLVAVEDALRVRDAHLDALNLAASYYRRHLKEIHGHTFDDNEGLSQIKIRTHAEEAMRAADGALAALAAADTGQGTA